MRARELETRSIYDFDGALSTWVIVRANSVVYWADLCFYKQEIESFPWLQAQIGGFMSCAYVFLLFEVIISQITMTETWPLINAFHCRHWSPRFVGALRAWAMTTVSYQEHKQRCDPADLWSSPPVGMLCSMYSQWLCAKFKAEEERKCWADNKSQGKDSVTQLCQ